MKVYNEMLEADVKPNIELFNLMLWSQDLNTFKDGTEANVRNQIAL